MNEDYMQRCSILETAIPGAVFEELRQIFLRRTGQYFSSDPAIVTALLGLIAENRCDRDIAESVLKAVDNAWIKFKGVRLEAIELPENLLEAL